eukprot:2745985-Prymnesium_polylepis.1
MYTEAIAGAPHATACLRAGNSVGGGQGRSPCETMFLLCVVCFCVCLLCWLGESDKAREMQVVQAGANGRQQLRCEPGRGTCACTVLAPQAVNFAGRELITSIYSALL